MAFSDLQIVPTPSPEEFMISVRIPDRKFTPDLYLKQGFALTSATTAFMNKTTPTTFAVFCQWAVEKVRVNEFGAYVYIKCEKADADHLLFYFAKAKTDTERRRPFAIRSSTMRFPWPAVLEDFYMVKSSINQSYDNGTTVQEAPRLVPRYREIPEQSYNSTVIIRQYLSEVPFTEFDVTHDQPQATSINGAYLGVEMNFRDCLHGTAVFPELVPGAQVVQGVGIVPAPIGRNPVRMKFPATNFTDRASFVVDDDVQVSNGLYLRQETEIIPPPPADASET